MKYSKSAIGLLTSQYRSVLKKCWLINVGLFALGAVAATPAEAADITITDNTAYTGASNGADTTTVETHYTSYTDGQTLAGAINTLNGDSSTNGSVDKKIDDAFTSFNTAVVPSLATKADTQVATGTYNYITAGTGVGANLISLNNGIDSVVDKLDDGATGYDIDAKTLKVGGTTVATTSDIANMVTTTTIANGSINTFQAGTDDDKKVVINGTAGTISIGSNTVATTADIAALDANVSQSASTTNPLALNITQADGVITGVSGSVAIDGTSIVVNSEGKLDIGSVDVADISTTNYASSALKTAVVGTKVDAASSADSAKAVTSDAISTDGTLVLDSGKLKVGTIAQSQVSGLTDALDAKQAKLTSSSGNAGNGISITDAGVISAKAGDTTITVDGNGIKVGTIAQSQVNGLSDALATKVNNADNFTDAANSDLIKNKTVVAAIQDTAAQVDVNTAKNGTQDTSIGNLYTAVNGGTYNPATGAVATPTTLASGFSAGNLTAAANELLTDITVTADGNYIKADKTAAQNLGLLDTQVKSNTDDITSMAALVGTTSAPAAGTGILAGKTITGATGTNNLNMVDAISYVAANGAGLSTNNIYTGTNTFGSNDGSQVIITNGGSLTANTSLKVGTDTTNMLTVSSTGTKIGDANAIVGTANSLDMGGNALTNVKGLTLTDGNTHTASLSVNENGLNTGSNLTVGGYIKATGIDTSTANTVKLGGENFTTAVTGGLTVSGDTALSGKLNVTGDTTLANTSVTGTLDVAGNTTLKNTSVDGTLDVTGKSTFGNATGSRIELNGGALTVKDSTQAQVAKIDNDGNASFNGTLDVAGLASLDGGLNVNDVFDVNATTGAVTLTNGTNTASLAMTDIKVATDDPSNPESITNVMKVTGTGLFTGDVASEKGFVVAQKNGVDQYEVKYSVDQNGNIESKGTLSVSDGKFAVDGDGAVKAADGKFTVDKDGAIVAANGGFTVAKDGKTIVGNDFAVTDKFTVAGATGNTVVGGNLAVRDKFTVDADTGNTAVAGTFSAAAAKFTIDDDGAVKAANGNFTVSKEGNTAVAGTMDIEGDTTIGDKFSVTADDGSFSAAGGKFAVNENGSIAAADNKFVVNKDGNITKAGTISAADGKFLVKEGGLVSAAAGTFLVKEGGLVTAAAGKFQVKDGGALSAAAGHFTVSTEGAVLAKSLAFEGDGSTVLVNKIDQGAAAITDGVADTDARKETMATTATVAKTIGNLAALYDGSETAASHGVTNVADVASAISTLSQNVETATGGTFAGAVWTGAVDAAKSVDYTYSPAATATATAGYHDIMSAVSQVASNVGAATTVAFNNVAAGNTVNANIDALNSKVGDMNTIGYGYKNLSNGTTTQPDTVVKALQNIDASMGTIHGLAAKLESEGKYQGNLASGTTVEQHLTALDSAIGNRANFEKMHYTQGSKTVVDAIGKLDTKLNSVDHEVRTMRHHYDSALASAAALSALVPNARAHGNTQLSLGTGMYHGHGAMAVGGFHWFSDNLLFNTGIAWDDNEATYRMGVTYSW